MLEGAFWSFVQAIGDGVDSEIALDEWRTTLREAVNLTWEQATRALGFDSRALAAAARCSLPIGKLLKSLSP
jgi:hypothetical protein